MTPSCNNRPTPARARRPLVAVCCAVAAALAITAGEIEAVDTIGALGPDGLAALVTCPTAHAQPANPPDASKPAPSAGDADDDDGEGDGAAQPDQESLDIDALRAEYLKLRDQLFRSRARAAAVASQLYSTRLQINLSYASARFYTVTRATVRLDGANVYDDLDGAVGKDRAPRYEGFVAPGRHVLTIRIEAVGKDDGRFTTATESSFTIQAPAGTDVAVTAAARDDGDIAYAWDKKQRGSYLLRMDVKVETVKRPDAPAGGGAKASARAASAPGERAGLGAGGGARIPAAVAGRHDRAGARSALTARGSQRARGR